MNPLHIPSIAAGGPKKKKRPKNSQGSTSNPLSLQKRTSNIVAETVWTKFKNQLSRLMETLSETKTRYIRCIKPNTRKAPLLMEHISTVEQLRCAGVVAAVTISRSAFPNRLEHLSVLDRFKSLWPKGDHNRVLQDQNLDPSDRRRKATDTLLTLALKEMEFEKNGSNFRAFVMGKTRAYFRAGALEFLEGERLKHLGTFATVLQTAARRFIVQSKYGRHRVAVVKLQTRYRRKLERKKFLAWRSAAIVIECWYRSVFAARAVFHLRRMIKATVIQTRWRIKCDSRRFRRSVAATVMVQAMARGSLQRPKFRQALIDKKEEAKLENQLRTLQKKLEEAEAKRHEAEKQAEDRVTAAVQQYKDNSIQMVTEGGAASASKSDDRHDSSQEQRRGPDASKADVAVDDGQAGNNTDTGEQSVQDLTAEQQQLMDESGKMLEYLRKEVFKLRSQNHQLKTDFDLLKDNNQRLMDANASAGASFAALNQHAKQLSKQNAQLVNEVQAYKSQTHKLHILQVELKEELNLKTATYVAEVQSRLQYQKALQKVTDVVQETCRDHRLVERVLSVADEVELDFMPASSHQQSSRNEQEDGYDSDTVGNDSRRGIFSYFFS